MIQNYTKPQSFIRQILEIVQDGVVAPINAFVYGPNYRLSRYTDVDEKATLVSEPYADASPVVLTFADSGFNSVAETVDQDTVKVFAEDLKLVLEEGIGDEYDTEVLIKSLSQPNRLIIEVDGNADTFPQVGSRNIRAGDRLAVTFSAAERDRTVTSVVLDTDGDVVELVLDGAATSKHVEDSWADNTTVAGSFDVYNLWSGEVPSDYVTISATTASVAVISIDGVTAEDGEGVLFPSFRSLQKGSVLEPIQRFTTSAQIVDAFGKIDPDNTLAFGLQAALRGSQGKAVYGARVRDNTVAAYLEVLKKAEQVRNLYAHAPLSYDIDVQLAVKTHVEAMSTWDVKRWRRAYAAVDIVAERELLEVSDNVVAQGDAFGNLVVVTGTVDFVTLGVEAEDIVRYNAVDYVIESVVGPDTLVLKEDASAIDGAISIWKGDTGRAQSLYAADRAKQLNSRRMIPVWTDRGQILDADASAVVVENFFLSAEVAGLRSAALPQQGLTQTEVEGVTSTPLMRTKYTEADLNLAASNGVFIITQDAEDTPVYIRHQLTSRTSQGPLYYEDSVGANVDEISFMLDDVTRGYIGKFNATPDTVRTIRNRITEELYNRSKSDRRIQIGPQILNFAKEDVTVEIDPVLRDRINITVRVTVPLPLNTIVIDIVAGVTFN